MRVFGTTVPGAGTTVTRGCRSGRGRATRPHDDLGVFEVVGLAGDGLEAIALAEALAPDVIVMDLRVAGLHGLADLETANVRGAAFRVIGAVIRET